MKCKKENDELWRLRKKEKRLELCNAEACSKALAEWKFLGPSGRGTVWFWHLQSSGRVCESNIQACFFMCVCVDGGG